MKTFRDNAGNMWSIAINITAVKRVRGLLNVDLLEVLDRDMSGKGKKESNLFSKLASDPVLLVDVLYCLCKPEADARNCSDEQFGMAMAGDAIEQATEAFMEELVDFFPSPKERALLKKALSKMTAWQARAVEEAEKRLDSPATEEAFQKVIAGANRMADAEVDALVRKCAGTSSGSAPESSE